MTLRAATRTATPSEPETRRYTDVVVANGHHWDPRWPEPSYPGAETFPGEQLHAHYYRTPDVLEGKRVLVLGIGNSACDIAVESSRVADETYLAMRRGAHIVPKFLFGVPTDHLTELAAGPRRRCRCSRLGMAAMLRLAQGRVTDYGLPEARPRRAARAPDGQRRPADPARPRRHRRCGRTSTASRAARCSSPTARAVEVDTVIYCTGYKVTFPFLDERVVPARDNHVDLYRRVVDPDHPGLYFVGLIQPLGAIMPLAEAQSEWVADLVDGRGRAAVVRRDAAADPGVRRAAAQALRRVEAAHHPGRLPRLPRPSSRRERRGRRGSGPRRPPPASGCRAPAPAVAGRLTADGQRGGGGAVLSRTTSSVGSTTCLARRLGAGAAGRPCDPAQLGGRRPALLARRPGGRW